MNDLSEDLRDYLREVGVYLSSKGIDDIIFIMKRDSHQYVASDMSPARAIVCLIDALYNARCECFESIKNQ